MAKVNPTTGAIKLEGGDVSTVALLAGIAASVSNNTLNAKECAVAATAMYREVIKEVLLTNDLRTDEDALDLLVEIWAALPDSNTDGPLGADLTERLANFLHKAGRLNGDDDEG